ncbi:MAG: PAS domain S-box protein [Ignavibacteriales bacterium]
METNREIGMDLRNDLIEAEIHHQADVDIESHYAAPSGNAKICQTKPRIHEEFIARFRADFSFSFANRAACDYLGISKEELKTLKATSCVPEEFREKWINILQSLGLEHPSITYEFQYPGPNGKICTRENTVWALFDYDGQFVEYQYIARDVTGQKQTEKQLQHRTQVEKALSFASKSLEDHGYEYVEKILEILGRAILADSAFVIDSSDDGRAVEFVIEWSDHSSTPKLDVQRQFNLNLYNCLMKQSREGEPVVISDINMLPLERAAEKAVLQGQGIKSLVMVPYYNTKGILEGILGFEFFKEAREMQEADLRSLSLAAGMLGSYRERQRVERMIQESEKNFRKLADTAPALIFVAQEDNAPLAYFNAAFETITGYTREECASLNAWDFVHPTHVELHRKYALARWDGKKLRPFRSEAKFVTKSGEVRWADLSACTIEWDKKPAILGVAYDITERMQMEEELLKAGNELGMRIEERTEELRRANEALQWEISERNIAEIQLRVSEERYRAMVEDQKELVMRMRPDLTLTYVNQGYCRFHDGIKMDFIGRNAVWPVHEEDVDRVRFFLENSISFKPEIPFLFRMFDARGNIRWIETTSNVICENGCRIEYQAVGRDVTERKHNEEALIRSEEKFRVLADTSPTGIFVFQQGKLKYVNKIFENRIGYSWSEMIDWDPIEKFVHLEDQEAVTSNSVRRMEGETVGPYKVRFINKEGQIIWGYFSAGVIEFEGEKAILGVVIDITEMKHMEEELLKASKLESLGILAGGIAHDFNNILTVINGNLSLGKMMIGTEDELYEMLVEIEEAAFQARDLTQQLLTFAKGGTPIKETASIADLIKDSANFALRGSNVGCTISIPDVLTDVKIDKSQISQVISQIIMNAHQSMPDGGMIVVKAKDVVVSDNNWYDIKPGKYVRISIKDTGIGITHQDLNRIFDPYFTTKQTGQGLGLATCYSIIKKHDGYISVDSAPGQGTTVYVYLPSLTEKVSGSPEPEKTILPMKGRILVMDDEESVRKTIGKILKHLKYQVEFASHGQEAIDLYVSSSKYGQSFDAVIMDLTIAGGMGGKEAARIIRLIDPVARLVVSSGYSNDEVMANYIQYGFCGMIQKPYDIETVYHVLNEVISSNNSNKIA